MSSGTLWHPVGYCSVVTDVKIRKFCTYLTLQQRKMNSFQLRYVDFSYYETLPRPYLMSWCPLNKQSNMIQNSPNAIKTPPFVAKKHPIGFARMESH